MNALRRFSDFLESRTGARTLVHRLLDEPVPGGARWAYVPGSMLLFLIALQVMTGIILAIYYAPSVTTAWASIVYFEEKITAGRLIRGLHGWGASAIVLGIALHYAQVVFFGSYKKPREVNWAIGLVLILVILVAAHTGYLLPWDQKGYWATKVATGIAGSTPVLGGKIQMAAQGGNDYGNLTLTRFFAIHVIVMPMIFLSLIGAHVFWLRKHGYPTAPSVAPDAKSQSFYPHQVLRNAIACALLLMALVALVRSRGGAGLEGPADPTSDYQPRPEWYFLPLFELLKHFQGPLEFVGAEVIPGLVFVALLALPWIDRSQEKAPGKRALALAIGLGPLVLAAFLGALAAFTDAQNEQLASQRKQDAEEAELARRLFLEQGGVPPEGPLALLNSYPPRLGKRVFKDHCSNCHVVEGEGKAQKAPELTGYLSHRWLANMIRAPQDPKFYGFPGFEEGMAEMRAKLEKDEPEALAAYVYSLRSKEVSKDPRVERGRKLFSDKDCNTCHELEPGKTGKPGDGPNLAGYGSDEWLVSFLETPSHARFHGEHNKMPAFKEKLSRDELKAVVVFLKQLAGE